MMRNSCAAAVCLVLTLTGNGNAQTLEEARTAVRIRDFSTAAGIYTTLAERGDMQARYQLAMLYGVGNGVPRDPAKAAILMQQVADSGDASAQYNYAQMLENGSGVAKDAAAARAWYERALSAWRAEGLVVEAGVFQADMQVALVNDGPVTIAIDSRSRE